MTQRTSYPRARMRDPLTPDQRSRAMKRVKLKNGPLERIIQCELRRAGLHFHRNYKRLRGSPDIVFLDRKVAVFIDGDFWHGWRLPAWEHKLTNFWKSKLRANRKRDQRNLRRLRTANWKVVRLWEHQIAADAGSCVKRIIRALRSLSDDRLKPRAKGKIRKTWEGRGQDGNRRGR